MPDSIDYDLDSLDRAMYETVHEYRNPTTGKKGAVGLAPVVGIPPSTLSNKTNPKEDFAHLSVKEALRVMLATKDHRIVRTLANEVGEACYPMPMVDFVGDIDVLNAVTEWQAKVGETAQAVRDTYADGRVENSEVNRVEQSLIEDLEEGLRLVRLMRGQAEPDTSPLKAVK